MEIETAKLRETLSMLEPVVPRKSTLPVLGYVRLGDGYAMATDLDTAVRIDLPEAQEPVLLPHKRVLELLRYVPGHLPSCISTSNGKLTITAGNTESSLNAQKPEDYPPFPEAKGESGATLDGDALVRALTAVLPYAATSQDRPILAGVHIETGESIEAAGADGFRLAWEKVPGKLAGPAMNIPTGAVSVLSHLWKGAAAPELGEGLLHLALAKRLIRLQWDESILTLHFGKVTMMAKLIQGSFPNYRQLIPTTTVASITVQAEDIMRALQQVNRLARDGSGIVRLVWEKGQLLVSAQSDEETVTVPVPAEMDGSGRVALNIGYLFSYFRERVGAVTLGLGGEGESSPVLFSYRGVPHVLLMPMFVKW